MKGIETRKMRKRVTKQMKMRKTKMKMKTKTKTKRESQKSLGQQRARNESGRISF